LTFSSRATSAGLMSASCRRVRARCRSFAFSARGMWVRSRPFTRLSAGFFGFDLRFLLAMALRQPPAEFVQPLLAFADLLPAALEDRCQLRVARNPELSRQLEQTDVVRGLPVKLHRLVVLLELAPVVLKP